MSNPYASPEADLTRVSSGSEGVSELTMEALRGTKKWVRLVGGILLFLAAVTALGGLAMMFGSFFAGRGSGRTAESIGVFIGAGTLYLLFAGMYFALGIYLVKYASAISRLLEDGQVSSLENALQHQQKFWRMAGGIAVVMLIMMVIGFAAAIIIPMAMR